MGSAASCRADDGLEAICSLCRVDIHWRGLYGGVKNTETKKTTMPRLRCSASTQVTLEGLSDSEQHPGHQYQSSALA